MPTNNTNSVHKTTDRAIEILDFIRRSNGATLGGVQEHFDLSRSTVYMHVNTLNQQGLVIRENGQYWIGLRFREFSESARRRKPGYQIIEKKVRELTSETESEVEFLVEEVGRINLVFHSESVSHDRVRLFAHNTAAGKAILSEYSEEEVQTILDRWGLPKQAPNTITDEEQLHEQLEAVSEKGYSYNDGECFEGYHGIGAPIEGLDGSVIGALTIGGPVYRVTEETLKNELADVLLDAVDAIKESLRSQQEAIYSEYANRS
ncbi:IclR family transcriptional regulator [Halolamina salifodinae]|uniref:DNA-binding IclR family transcriptional regulator n=1 Tax=Halolamina salifodinae TaxID=1202767 RepID=A0A8T4GZN9_9EURY|nr:IclR family transcriptional regulator [Halolamina salifodinae]MBP1986825.1 DNA-binding IclR family transcriptional regulator [Halolamina salifodinae]